MIKKKTKSEKWKVKKATLQHKLLQARNLQHHSRGKRLITRSLNARKRKQNAKIYKASSR